MSYLSSYQSDIAFHKKNTGFTLIEVLIAAVILFSALAITADLFSASSFTAQKARNKAHFYQVNPVAIIIIKSEIRKLSENRKKTQFSGEFTLIGIHYQWQAQRIAFKPRAPDFDDFDPPRAQFGLFQLNVIGLNALSKKSNEFQFKVATW